MRFGVGRAARIEATVKADELRAAGVAARALFKLEWGGWVVLVAGTIRRADDAASAPPDGRPR
jgi:hypothetical protein